MRSAYTGTLLPLLLFVCLGIRSRRSLHWPWGFSVLLVYLCCFFFHFVVFLALCHNFQNPRLWTRGQSCSYISFPLMATRLLAFKFIFLAENSYIFFSKEFTMGKFFLCICLFIYLFFCSYNPGNMNTVTIFSRWACSLQPPTNTNFLLRTRKKEDGDDYFIRWIEILGGQSIIDEVKKQKKQ